MRITQSSVPSPSRSPKIGTMPPIRPPPAERLERRATVASAFGRGRHAHPLRARPLLAAGVDGPHVILVTRAGLQPGVDERRAIGDRLARDAEAGVAALGRAVDVETRRGRVAVDQRPAQLHLAVAQRNGARAVAAGRSSRSQRLPHRPEAEVGMADCRRSSPRGRRSADTILLLAQEPPIATCSKSIGSSTRYL